MTGLVASGASALADVIASSVNSVPTKFDLYLIIAVLNPNKLTESSLVSNSC